MSEFLNQYIWPGLIIVAQILALAVPVMIGMAYLVYAERKILGAMQLRQGPTLVGPFGLLQSFADALKMLMKETVVPAGANRLLFILAPILTFVLALIAWVVIPVHPGWVIADLNVGVLYLLAISSLGVYGIIIAGWASNSKYAFLGGLRSASQMVSYEVSLGLVIVTVLLTTGSLNLRTIIETPQPWWIWLLQAPMAVVFFISALAETNRAPFDLPEGESELAGGYNVEYSAMMFALFFLGEYMNMMLLSSVATILFLGGYLPPFGLDIPPLNWIPGLVWFVLKVSFVLFCFIWIRATVPRFRYDQLMRLGWKVFLPFSLLWVLIVAGTLLITKTLPGMQG